MKKIALALVAVSALGLAACTPNGQANNTVDTNTEATVNEAGNDVNASEAATDALDSAGNALENAGEAVENAASDVGNAAENAVTK